MAKIKEARCGQDLRTKEIRSWPLSRGKEARSRWQDHGQDIGSRIPQRRHDGRQGDGARIEARLFVIFLYAWNLGQNSIQESRP